MAKYSANMQGVTLNNTQDFHTIVTVATGAGSVVKVYEIWISGEAGSSSVARIAVNRPTAIGITIGATVQTPEKIDPASTNSSVVLAGSASTLSSWTTQPAISTNDVLSPSLNAFGGVVRWVAPPDSEIIVGGQGAVANLIFRARSGTPAISGHILFEER